MRILLFLFLIGQVIRFPLFGGGGTLLDLGIVILDGWLLLHWRTWVPRLRFFPWIWAYGVFLLSIALSLFFAFVRGDHISPFALTYLLRFLAYQGVWIAVWMYRRPSRVDLRWMISLFALLGFIQLVVFPDLTLLSRFGWDPHYGRLVSTVLDPNFAGWILAIGAMMTFSKMSRQHVLLPLMIVVAMLLTFSRSSLLAFFISLLLTWVVRPQRMIAIVLSFLLLLGGGLFLYRNSLEQQRQIDRGRSFAARMTTIERALVHIGSRPLVGVGFNRFADASMEASVLRKEDRVLHSSASADNSILFLWATAGSIGVVTYGWWLVRLSQWLWQRHDGQLWVMTLIGWVIHSQFVNSLFFVPIIFMMYVWLGIVLRSYTGAKHHSPPLV